MGEPKLNQASAKPAAARPSTSSHASCGLSSPAASARQPLALCCSARLQSAQACALSPSAAGWRPCISRTLAPERSSASKQLLLELRCGAHVRLMQDLRLVASSTEMQEAGSHLPAATGRKGLLTVSMSTS